MVVVNLSLIALIYCCELMQNGAPMPPICAGLIQCLRPSEHPDNANCSVFAKGKIPIKIQDLPRPMLIHFNIRTRVKKRSLGRSDYLGKIKYFWKSNPLFGRSDWVHGQSFTQAHWACKSLTEVIAVINTVVNGIVHSQQLFYIFIYFFSSYVSSFYFPISQTLKLICVT